MRIGIIGLGFMGVTHLFTWRRLPDVQVAAVCARSERLLAGDFSDVSGNFGEPFGRVDLSAVSTYRDWDALIADPSVDAVDICLPTDLHATVATAALAAGKHVLCEKPMALTSSECDTLLVHARASGRILMIGHILRFWPAYEYLHQFLQSPAIGRVRSATFTRSCGIPQWSHWLPDRARSGGALLDLLIHDLDQIVFSFGLPAAVRAKPLLHDDGTDTVSATLLYERGPEVRVQGGWWQPGTPFSSAFQILADQAQLDWNANRLTRTGTLGQAELVTLEQTDPFAAQLSYFTRCAETGNAPSLCPPEQSAAAVKLALALRQSRDAGGDQIACAL